MFSEQLKRDLIESHVEVDGKSPETLRNSVVAQLASFHPDKTGGQFLNEEQENNFARIKALLERVDHESSISTQLIPLHQVVTLVDVLSKLQTNNALGASPQFSDITDQYKNRIRRRYALPKITSALVAAVCFALFSLVGSFRQSPLYKFAFSLYVKDSGNDVYQWGKGQTETLTRQLDDLIDRHTFAQDEISKLQSPAVKSESSSVDSSDEPFPSLYDEYSRQRRFAEINASQGLPGNRNRGFNLNLLDSDEPSFLRETKSVSARLTTDVAASITRLGSINPLGTDAKKRKASLVVFLTELQDSLATFDVEVKSSEEDLSRHKRAVINEIDGRLLLRLAILTGLACLVFLLLWIRERSDERWVDFLSSEEGAELVLDRLCANSNIMARQPPGFSLTEFTKVVGAKDVPMVLSPFVGSTLDLKRLGQISSFLLDRLKDKKVVSERKTSALRSWFDVHIEKVTPAGEDSSASG